MADKILQLLYCRHGCCWLVCLFLPELPVALVCGDEASGVQSDDKIAAVPPRSRGSAKAALGRLATTKLCWMTLLCVQRARTPWRKGPMQEQATVRSCGGMAVADSEDNGEKRGSAVGTGAFKKA